MTISILGFLGLLVSAIAGLAAGVHLPTVFLRPIISAICMAGLGAGIYFFLHWQAPDLLSQKSNDDNFNNKEMFQSDTISHTSLANIEESNEEDLSGETHRTNQDPSSSKGYNSGESYDENDLLNRDSIRGEKYSSVTQDTVVIDGIPLENKPELMAQAVQHLLDQDDDDK